MEGIALHLDDDIIDLIVDKAFEFKLGARGLRSICESILLDYMFELPSQENVNELRITKTFAAEKIALLRLKSMKAA
jgi:ATP-dependent Clp protease ATP-binding subunit ClpX